MPGFEMKHFYLSLTQSCNLVCDWCFWRAGTEPAVDQFDLDEVLARICGHDLGGERQAGIVFYGGEPTLRMDRMKLVMDEVERLRPEVDWHFAVQTNGTKLDRLRPIADRFWYLSVSINEYTVAGIDWAELRWFRERMPIIARMTYAGDSLVAPLRAALDGVTHVYWQLVNGPDLRFGLDEYERELEALMQLANEHPDKRFVPLDYAWSWQNGLLEQGLLAGFPCGVGSELIYVDTRGQVHACDELSVDCSSSDVAELQSLIGQTCASCSIREGCRGRCPASRLKYGREAFERYCEFNHLLFRKVTERGYAGRVIDDVSLQTEVMH